MDSEENLMNLWFCLTLTVAELKAVVEEYYKINQSLAKPRYKHLRRAELQEFIDFYDIKLDEYIYVL